MRSSSDAVPFLMIAFLMMDPRLDTLRAEPRFNDLLRRMGF